MLLHRIPTCSCTARRHRQDAAASKAEQPLPRCTLLLLAVRQSSHWQGA